MATHVSRGIRLDRLSLELYDGDSHASCLVALWTVAVCGGFVAVLLRSANGVIRGWVLSSAKDGKPITGKTVEKLIKSELFYKLNDEDAVSLYCVGILQFVLLGLEDRPGVPDWILRIANDRDGWDKYTCGSYVWPTLYSQLRDANVKRWPSLYDTEPKKDVDKKTYLLFGFTWAFKGRLPIERLTPDEIEARSDWWVSIRAYFDGRISEA
ncbi:hypothetical protein Tco_1073733 [Tanacetum coccineum]